MHSRITVAILITLTCISIIGSTKTGEAGSHSLANLLQTAATSSPDVLAAERELRSQQAQLESLLAGSNLQITASARPLTLDDGQGQRDPLSETAPGVRLQMSYGSNLPVNLQANLEIFCPDTGWNHAWDVTASSTIYGTAPGGATLDQSIRSCRHQIKRASLNLQLARARAQLDVITAYSGLTVASSKLELAEKELELAEAGRERVKKQIELGEADESDLLAAKLAVITAEEKALSASRQIKENLDTIAWHLGETDMGGIDSIDANHDQWRSVLLPPVDYDPALLLTSARSYSVDVIDASHAVEEAEIALQEARQDYLPRVTLEGSINSSDKWSVGLDMRYDLYTSGQRSAKLEKAKLACAGARAGLEQAQDALEHKLEKLCSDLRLAEMHLEQQRLRVRRSEIELEKEKELFANGLIPADNLQKAELELQEALVTLDECRRDMLNLQLELTILTTGGIGG